MLFNIMLLSRLLVLLWEFASLPFYCNALILAIVTIKIIKINKK